MTALSVISSDHRGLLFDIDHPGDLMEASLMLLRPTKEYGGDGDPFAAQYVAAGVAAYITSRTEFCVCPDEPELCIRCHIRAHLGLPKDSMTRAELSAQIAAEIAADEAAERAEGCNR